NLVRSVIMARIWDPGIRAFENTQAEPGTTAIRGLFTFFRLSVHRISVTRIDNTLEVCVIFHTRVSLP
ncbi:MAG: hypothetical protein ACPG4T_08475, partial [Nannocystaceae bacterium]